MENQLRAKPTVDPDIVMLMTLLAAYGLFWLLAGTVIGHFVWR